MSDAVQPITVLLGAMGAGAAAGGMISLLFPKYVYALDGGWQFKAAYLLIGVAMMGVSLKTFTGEVDE